MNFKKGDRIRSTETGFTAKVDGTSFNSIYQEDEVYVTWDHMPEKGSCGYSISDVASAWMKIDAQDANEAGVDFAPADVNDKQTHSFHPWFGTSVKPQGQGIDFIPIEIKLEDVKVACEHKWVEVGFMHTKTVCYHCDIEKP